MFCLVELMTLLYFFHKGDLFVLSNRNTVEENDVDIYSCRVMCVHVVYDLLRHLLHHFPSETKTLPSFSISFMMMSKNLGIIIGMKFPACRVLHKVHREQNVGSILPIVHSSLDECTAPQISAKMIAEWAAGVWSQAAGQRRGGREGRPRSVRHFSLPLSLFPAVAAALHLYPTYVEFSYSFPSISCLLPHPNSRQPRTLSRRQPGPRRPPFPAGSGRSPARPALAIRHPTAPLGSRSGHGGEKRPFASAIISAALACRHGDRPFERQRQRRTCSPRSGVGRGFRSSPALPRHPNVAAAAPLGGSRAGLRVGRRRRGRRGGRHECFRLRCGAPHWLPCLSRGSELDYFVLFAGVIVRFTIRLLAK